MEALRKEHLQANNIDSFCAKIYAMTKTNGNYTMQLVMCAVQSR